MMLTNRLVFSSLLFVTALSACGDDNGTTKDGGTDACVGHFCGTPPAVTDPEGGNIIFEYIYLDTELQAAFGLPPGVTTLQRVMAYFMESQTPNANPLPQPGQCNNLVATKGWPLYVGSPHQDLDVGAVTFSGKNTAGTATTINAAMMGPATDSIGRPHDIFYQAINPDAAKYLVPDSSYTVNFGGAGNIAATAFENAIFLPSATNYTVTSPSLEDNGPLIANTDFTVHWTPGTNMNLPAGDEVLGLTWLVDAAGSPTHVCVAPHSAGQFTIPGTAIAEYKQIAIARGTNPSKAILLRQALVHHVRRLPNNEPANLRRIDMLGVLCWAQLVNVQ